MSHSTSTYDPLRKAGITFLSIKLAMILYFPIIWLLHSLDSIDFSLYIALSSSTSIITGVINLVALIFLHFMLSNMELLPESDTIDHEKIRIIKILNLILIIIISIFIFVSIFFYLGITFGLFNLSGLSLAMLKFIIFTSIAFEFLYGILFIIVFSQIGSTFNKFSKLRKFRILIVFIFIFGIATGLSEIIMASMLTLDATSIPVNVEFAYAIQFIFQIVTSLSGIASTISCIGFILIPKELNNS